MELSASLIAASNGTKAYDSSSKGVCYNVHDDIIFSFQQNLCLLKIYKGNVHLLSDIPFSSVETEV